ncbi:tRNA (adenosine(37)-N6)-threonylcarbamoyltransferase complex ATPase subunit type 1 TsaE [Amorphus orientalis]|uniref:tRNA threonylcarbamoyladenosine biosynthesis protein TsaE n=1 Tax=Amorphus orientalis TaxID=649198 RepID=A0AAE4ATV3_9HYPH|nr:tRNA (adenosine(37)-N6)-threonylcarbamoyltransferase complex ATPase subunit type 1 TsaE [Amorphus orientalis]MDQ0316738.1 tRNA threonylcarbamoyl adenosine modification protein YjeE [Amorphus orientalis]
MSEPVSTLTLSDETDTVRLAEDIAAVLKPGDLVTLSGPLGAGKTTFARALLRAIADDPDLEVPSPTFTLLQPYDLPRLQIAHVDLYRLSDPEEAAELALDDLLVEGAVLVEWPEQGDGMLPAPALAIALEPEPGAEMRSASLEAAPSFAHRLARSRAARRFLVNAGYRRATRRHLQGDASSRAYERIGGGREPAILMNAPTQPDGPAIYGGQPYSKRAHLAETVRPFVAVGDGLRAHGYSAPRVIAHDFEAGFLLLEDLGRDPILRDGQVDEDRYALAVDLLADLHNRPMIESVPLPGGARHVLPPFDRGVFLIELSLYPDWFIPFATGGEMESGAQEAFLKAWDDLFPLVEDAEQHWLLRDFHSPNLMWLEGRKGLGKVGLLDYQDALIGPSAYDVASLLQDVRVTVSPEQEARLFDRYCAARAAADPDFDRDDFALAYALMAAQRATKVLGIFARLARRDGKTGYLAHIPRVSSYLARTLTDPVFGNLTDFYDAAFADLAPKS